MKALLFILSIVLLTACGDKDSKQISTETSEDISLKGYLIDGYPSVNGGYGYSVLPGQKISWHLNSNEMKEGYITILDIMDKEIDRFDAIVSPQTIHNSEPWKNGFGYEVSVTYQVPSNMKSGVYFLNGNRDFMFTVLPEQSAEITIVIPTNTMNAYSCAGGRSSYNCKDNAGLIHKREPELSFSRPIRNSDSWIKDVLMLMEDFLVWSRDDLEKKYKSIGYITDKELETSHFIDSSKVLIVPGHNEYWTLNAVNNLEAYLDSGRHAIVAGGNILWWHSRYSELGSLITYKAKTEFEEPGKETINLQYVGKPAYTILGGSFVYGGYNDADEWNKNIKKPMKVVEPNSPIFRDTSIGLCSEVDLSHNHELDGVPILGFDSTGYPVPSYGLIKQHKVQILAYTWGYRNGHNLGTIHAAQRTTNSGYMLQFGSNGAAGAGFKNSTQHIFKKVLSNSVEILYNDMSPFSPEYQILEVETQYLTPHEEKFKGAVCG
ncbi:N,N-dimethylformamidase beta subunit family domain-containing protein [Pseudoalteromonas sp. SSM20]|uniref:N,N-dimethylformamidase beta subunit family domain-containing protein n=1 Tax=Pseudoalteromonas sp. SSM20 TaxID=3139394 RepID=UPI003BAA0764